MCPHFHIHLPYMQMYIWQWRHKNRLLQCKSRVGLATQRHSPQSFMGETIALSRIGETMSLVTTGRGYYWHLLCRNQHPIIHKIVPLPPNKELAGLFKSNIKMSIGLRIPDIKQYMWEGAVKSKGKLATLSSSMWTCSSPLLTFPFIWSEPQEYNILGLSTTSLMIPLGSGNDCWIWKRKLNMCSLTPSSPLPGELVLLLCSLPWEKGPVPLGR